MRFLVSLSALLVTLSVATQGFAVQTDEKIAASVGRVVGDLQILVSTLDRGVVQQGEILTFDFPYKVEGDGPVRVLGIHQDCGCLVSQVKAGMLLDKNSAGFLRVQANTAHFYGNFDKRITLLTDEPDKASYSLRVLAKIERSVTWSPPLVELDLQKEVGMSTKIMVRPLSKQRIHIEKLNYNEDNLEVKALARDDVWELDVRWKGEKPTGPWAENIEVITSGVVRSFRIPVVERAPQRQAKSP